MTITLILFWKNFQKKLIKKFFLFGDFNKDPADKDLWFAQHNYYIRSSVLSDMVCLDVKIPRYFDSVILSYTCRFAIIPLNLIHQLSQSSSNLVPSVQFLQYYVFVCTLSGLAFWVMTYHFPHTFYIFLIPLERGKFGRQCFFLSSSFFQACPCAANIKSSVSFFKEPSIIHPHVSLLLNSSVSLIHYYYLYHYYNLFLLMYIYYYLFIFSRLFYFIHCYFLKFLVD